ncbi:hypothetical protein QF042_002151 [Pedobacter sp. W3I1]|nr:hypothetical protein [Pedobacter sp. W3I1]
MVYFSRKVVIARLIFSLAVAIYPIGVRNEVGAHATSKMECCLGHLAPVEVLPCSNEVRGSEAYKRKTGGTKCFTQVLRSKKNS